MPLSFQRSSPAARRRARYQALGVLLMLAFGLAWLTWYVEWSGRAPAPGETPPANGTESGLATELAQITTAALTPASASSTPARPAVGAGTPTASRTPAASLSPTPAPSATPTPTPTPQLVSHLLFLSEGRLGRWDPFSDSLDPLAPASTPGAVQQIVEYSASQNGRWIAFLRQMGVTPEGPHDLVLLDLAVRRTVTLIEGGSRLYHIQISPNGAWVSYTTQAAGGGVYALNVETQRANLVGRCVQAEEQICSGLPVWSFDSAEIYWSDQRGLLRAAPQGAQADELLPSLIDVTDPRGLVTQVEVTYQALQPSPAGRYVLAQASPRNSEVTWQALVDTRIVRMVEVPGTYQFQDNAAQAGWMLDGRLLQVFPPGAGSEALTVRIWRVLPTRDDLLLVQSEREYALPGLHSGMRAAWIEQHDERGVFFVMRPDDPGGSALLLRLDLRYRSLAKINEVPFDPRQVWFSPDLSGALAAGPEGQTWFAPADGSEPYSLTEKLGRNLEGFTWLPPVGVAP